MSDPSEPQVVEEAMRNPLAVNANAVVQVENGLISSFRAGFG
jgi:hypothetical protein